MRAAGYEPLPSAPPDDGTLDALLGGEAEGAAEWSAPADLDRFLTRVYRYWAERGFSVTVASRAANLLALGFTLCMSALLLLGIDWAALRKSDCLREDACDIWNVAVKKHPLKDGATAWNVLCCLYLAAFAAYWAFALVQAVHEARDLLEVRHFFNERLGVSERRLATATWPEVAQRVVAAQRSVRLRVAGELSELELTARIMRRENYLIGMLNKGVLALNVPVPGLRRHVMLTKTLEWNLWWCLLDPLFDEGGSKIKREALADEAALRRRLKAAAVLNALISPFLLAFLLIYFFMKNAERFYHHPSSAGTRRWSPLARWRLREFNELPWLLDARLGAAHPAADRYVAQFPSHGLAHVGRLTAFVAGSFAALLLVLTLMDERLLERDLLGRQVVWWLALLGVVLAVSRGLVAEDDPGAAVFDPELAMLEVAAHTHHLPRHWRSRAHTLEVQQEFEALFRYKAVLFLEELASVVLTPVILWRQLPCCAGAVLRYVADNTTTLEGAGDVCSMSAFDLPRHGSGRYCFGVPGAGAPRGARSRQGKVEKSLVSFAAAHFGWEPTDEEARRLLHRVGISPGAASYFARLDANRASNTFPAGATLLSMLGSEPQNFGPGAARLHRSARGAVAAGSTGLFASAEIDVAVLGRDAMDPLRKVTEGQILLQCLYDGVVDAGKEEERRTGVDGGNGNLRRPAGSQLATTMPVPPRAAVASPRGMDSASGPGLHRSRRDSFGSTPPVVSELSVLNRTGSGVAAAGGDARTPRASAGLPW